MKRGDILTLLSRLGVKEKDTTTSDHSPEVGLRCALAPWEHKGGRDRTPSMSIHVNPQGPSKWNCFSCGYGGQGLLHLVELIQQRDHTRDLTQLMVWVIEADDIDLGRALDDLPEFGAPPPSTEPPPSSFPEECLEPFARSLHTTLATRGVTIDSAKRWGFRYDRLRRRALLPMRDYMGALQGVTGRATSPDQQPKYLHYSWLRFGDSWELRGALPRDNEPQPDQVVRFPRASRLYGEHLVQPGQRLVIVEGPLDAVLLDQLLVERMPDLAPVAINGAKLTSVQIDLVMHLCDEVIVFSDPDIAGDKGKEKALLALSSRIRTRVVAVPQEVVDSFSGEKPDPAFLAVRAPEVVLQLLASAAYDLSSRR